MDELLTDWKARSCFSVALWILISVVTVWLTIRANKINRQLVNLALTDYLTGMHNRRAVLQKANQVKRSQNFVDSLSVLMIDIDHFKKINDEFGHAIGDEVIRAVSKTIKSHIRSTDIVGRYGGEEFLVFLPNTGETGAVHLAESLRELIEKQTIIKHRVTISIGVATILKNELTLEEIIESADEALYAAKAAGRNCIKIVKLGSVDISTQPDKCRNKT